MGNIGQAGLRQAAREYLVQVAIRRKKADVIPDLPPKRMITLRLKLRPEQEVLYKAATCELKATVSRPPATKQEGLTRRLSQQLKDLEHEAYVSPHPDSQCGAVFR